MQDQQQPFSQETEGKGGCGPSPVTDGTSAPTVGGVDTLSSVFLTASSSSASASPSSSVAFSRSHLDFLLHMLAVEVPTWEALRMHPAFLSVVECGEETVAFSLAVSPTRRASSDASTPPFRSCESRVATPCIRLHPLLSHSQKGKANLYFSFYSPLLPSSSSSSRTTTTISPKRDAVKKRMHTRPMSTESSAIPDFREEEDVRKTDHSKNDLQDGRTSVLMEGANECVEKGQTTGGQHRHDRCQEDHLPSVLRHDTRSAHQTNERSTWDGPTATTWHGSSLSTPSHDTEEEVLYPLLPFSPPSRTCAASSSAVASPFCSFASSPSSVSTQDEETAALSPHARRCSVEGATTDGVPAPSPLRFGRPREGETRHEPLQRHRGKWTRPSAYDKNVSNPVWQEGHQEDTMRSFPLSPDHERPPERISTWRGAPHHSHTMAAQPTYSAEASASTPPSIRPPMRKHEDGVSRARSSTIRLDRMQKEEEEDFLTTSAPLLDREAEKLTMTDDPPPATAEEEKKFLALLLNGAPKQTNDTLGPSAVSSLAGTTGEANERGKPHRLQEKPACSPFLFATERRDTECTAEDTDETISPTGQVFLENERKSQRRFRPSWQHAPSKRSSFSTGYFTSSRKKYECPSHSSI